MCHCIKGLGFLRDNNLFVYFVCVYVYDVYIWDSWVVRFVTSAADNDFMCNLILSSL